MKKLFLFLTSLVLATTSYASVLAPMDQRNMSLYTIDFVGALPCVINTSTGTNAVECSTGRGAAFGVQITSPTNVSEYLVLRDSNTANTSSSSFTAVGVQGNGTTQVLPGATLYFPFPRPIQFLNGLSANMTIAPQNGELWTVIYRPLKATE